MKEYDFETGAPKEAGRDSLETYAEPEQASRLRNEVNFISDKLCLYANILDTEKRAAMSEMYITERINGWRLAFDYFDNGIEVPHGYRIVFTPTHDITLHMFHEDEGAYDYLNHQVLNNNHKADTPLPYEPPAPDSVGSVTLDERRKAELPPSAYINFGNMTYLSLDDLATELRNGGALEVLSYEELVDRYVRIE